MIQRFSFHKLLFLAIFSIASTAQISATPNIGCPNDFSFTFTDQASLDGTFADYIRAFRATEGDCAITTMTDLSTLSPPSFSGGCATILFEVTDCDTTVSCSATFTALGSGIPAVTPVCPAPMTLANCMSDEEAMTSFRTWLEGFTYSGGCNVVTTDLSIYSPPGCGGTTTVTFEVTDLSDPTRLSLSCSSTFAIPAEVAAPDPAAGVPTMGEWGIICSFLILMIVGVVELKRTSSFLPTK